MRNLKMKNIKIQIALVISLSLVLFLNVYAQEIAKPTSEREKIKISKIKSETEWATTLKENKEINTKVFYREFNDEGNVKFSIKYFCVYFFIIF